MTGPGRMEPQGHRSDRTLFAIINLSISASNSGISCLAWAIKSWSASVAPKSSMSSPLVIMKFEPLVWSRPSIYDFHGPAVALAHR